MQQRTSSSPTTPPPPLFVVPTADVNPTDASVHRLEERRALAEHLDDPLNRYYRYPAARGLLRIAGGLPLRPDHITYLHTSLGIVGAALIAVGGTSALIASFF